jgi:hypothetical protein
VIHRWRARASRLAIGWLVVSLLLSQTLAMVHRVVHGTQDGPDVALQAHGDDARDALAPHSHSLFETVFSGHGEASDCRLYDQLGHSDALPGVPLLSLPLAPAAYLLQYFQGEALARWVALFDARGPPSVR